MSSGSAIPVYLFFGPPGSGKGSISQMCADKLGWVHLTTGKVCRQHVSNGTELGKQIAFAMVSGKLVSDSVIIDIVVQWLKDTKKSVSGIILDGAPRTIEQARGVLSYLNEHSERYCVRVVNFKLEENELIVRLTSRRVCQNKSCEYVYSLRDSSLQPKKNGVCDKCGSPLMQRSDDKEETVKARLAVYKKHAAELLEFYKKMDVEIATVDVNASIEEVFEKFLKTAGFGCDTDKK